MNSQLKGLAKYLIAINVLEQATVSQIADYLNLHFVSVKRAMGTLTKPKDGSKPLVSMLAVQNKLHQERGNVPLVVSLSEAGRRYLRQHSIAVTARHDVTETVAKPHILAVNEVLVKAIKLCREIPWLYLFEYKTEAELFAKPMRIPLSPHETVGLAPDLWLDVRGKTRGRKCFAIEVNLTPVAEKVWREKIRSYLNCVPVYTKQFGTDIIQVVVIVATGENFPPRLTPYENRLAARKVRGPQAKERWERLKAMIKWTQEELTANQAGYMADMFLFTDFALDRATPTQLFLNQHFLKPFAPYTYPLIKPQEEKTDA